MALSAARTTVSNKGPIKNRIGYKTKATKVFYNGALVAVDTGGYLVPATTTVGQRVVGVVDLGNLTSKDTTGESDGDTTLEVISGIFPFASGTSTDALTIADLEKFVYVSDDQTVARLPGSGRPIAGILKKIEGSLYYVAVGDGAHSPGAVGDSKSTLFQGPGSSEAFSSPGALSVATEISLMTTDGTDAVTLADGLFKGQRKVVTVVAGTNTPIATITPATASGFTTVTALGAVGDSAEFIWTGAAWVLGPCFGVTFT